MNVEQTIQALIELIETRRITRTQFATISIPATAGKAGIPLGQGKCKAVILYVNSLVLDTTTKTAIADNMAQIYYGDSQKQFRELLAGQSSDIIFCKDLQEVYVRGNGVANHVQVTIYLDDDNEAES